MSFSFVFNAFDEKNTEELTFLEFLQALSLHSKGKPHDKLECKPIFSKINIQLLVAFEIYDNGNEGKIAYGDVMELFEAILCMFGAGD